MCTSSISSSFDQILCDQIPHLSIDESSLPQSQHNQDTELFYNQLYPETRWVCLKVMSAAKRVSTTTANADLRIRKRFLTNSYFWYLFTKIPLEDYIAKTSHPNKIVKPHFDSQFFPVVETLGCLETG